MKKSSEENKNIRIGLIGEAILGVLVAGTVVSVFALFPGVALAIGPFIKKKKRFPRQVIVKSLDSLIATGLVKRVKSPNGVVVLRLTKKGSWEALLRHRTLPTATQEKNDWDKMWRLVIFDIPNEKNRKRSDLRRAVSMYGFKQLQKSVWVYPYECDDFVQLLKSHLDVSRDVLYMKVTYIENDRHLRKEFDL